MQIFSKKSYFRCFFAGKRAKMRMNQDATRAPSGAVSRAAPAAGNPLENHALLRFFRKERIRRKEKRANCKSCLRICSLLYAVIFALK